MTVVGTESRKPLYVSRPTVRSLWQEYRLHDDRIELDTLVFGTVRVPLDDLEAVALRPPMVVFDVLRGDYGLGDVMRAPKLDLADLSRHVVLEKTGFWKQFRITPDDPEAFVHAVEQALERHRAARAGGHTAPPRRPGPAAGGAGRAQGKEAQR